MNPLLASLRRPRAVLTDDSYLALPVLNGDVAEAQPVAQPKATQAGKEGFGGSFKSLNSEQQKLVVDLVQAYARTAKTQLDPEKVYDGARQSVRTTFDAVTHAIWNTKTGRHRWEIVGYRT